MNDVYRHTLRSTKSRNGKKKEMKIPVREYGTGY